MWNHFWFFFLSFAKTSKLFCIEFCTLVEIPTLFFNSVASQPVGRLFVNEINPSSGEIDALVESDPNRADLTYSSLPTFPAAYLSSRINIFIWLITYFFLSSSSSTSTENSLRKYFTFISALIPTFEGLKTNLTLDLTKNSAKSMSCS